MSSSAWVLMDDECDCGGPPPNFHLPPPPVPPDFPCELLDISCPAKLNLSDAEFKRIGTFPSLAVILSCTLLSAVILLVITAVVWRKRRKGVTQTKDFDHHHHQGSVLGNRGNGLLYEDLSHARPRPPIATPGIEMLDVNHHGISNNGCIVNSKLDFSYFLNPPPIYEELPELDGGHSDRNNGPSDDEFAEDELSVIDVPISQLHPGSYDPRLMDPDSNTGRYNNNAINTSKSRVQSLNRKRNGRNINIGSMNQIGTNNFNKSERSLDRRNRGNKYPGTNPRSYLGVGTGRATVNSGNGGMLILSDHTGMTMKIPPHLVAVLAESALCNGGNLRPYEVIPASGLPHPGSNGQPVNNGGLYPSSRSSGSSYGDGSVSSSRINPNGTSVESSSFDSGITASCINSPAYDQTSQIQYSLNPYEYTSTQNGTPAQFHTSQHPNFRRMRMATSDRDHPLYNNQFNK